MELFKQEYAQTLPRRWGDEVFRKMQQREEEDAQAWEACVGAAGAGVEGGGDGDGDDGRDLAEWPGLPDPPRGGRDGEMGRGRGGGGGSLRRKLSSSGRLLSASVGATSKIGASAVGGQPRIPRLATQHILEEETAKLAAPGEQDRPQDPASMDIAELISRMDELDLSCDDRLERLNEDDLSDVFECFSQCRGVNLSGWRNITPKAVRALSMQMGASLKSLNLSHSAINDAMIEVLCPNLEVLCSLDLSDCLHVSDAGIGEISKVVHNTLRHLRISRCPRISVESMLWLSGVLGYARPPCRKLQVLEFDECPELDDKAIIAIMKVCRKLKRVNFHRIGNGTRVTDKGICAMAKVSKHLEVLDVSECKRVTDKSMVMLGRKCPKLRILNVSRTGPVTDHGLVPLSEGCPYLYSLNLAGHAAISEFALGVLGTNCPGLEVLNISGCTAVTMNGLRALIEGMRFVEQAHEYVGFKPKQGSEQLRAQAYVDDRILDATKAIQRWFRKYRAILAAKRMLDHRRMDGAAVLVTRCVARVIHMRRLRREVERQKYDKAVLLVQRVHRGRQGRKRALRRKKEVAAWLRQRPYAIRIQTAFRRYTVRKHDKLVGPALRQLAIERSDEVRSAAAVSVQCAVRCMLSRKRVQAWGEVVLRRELDLQNGAVTIQCLVRQFEAKLVLHALRIERDQLADVQNRAARRIQAFCNAAMGKFSGQLKAREIAMLKRARTRAALRLQYNIRGYLARERVFQIKLQDDIRNFAATVIQKNYRCAQVMHWRDMRMNILAAFILDRQTMEHDARTQDSRFLYQQFINSTAKDSASDSDDVGLTNDWKEMWDETHQCPYWYNPALNEMTYEEPAPLHALERAVVGMRVQVFWPMEQQAFLGWITRYNLKRGRHRVEYDDGDHEWMNLEEERERVQVWVEKPLTWEEIAEEEERKKQEAEVAEKKQLQKRRAKAKKLGLIDEDTGEILDSADLDMLSDDEEEKDGAKEEASKEKEGDEEGAETTKSPEPTGHWVSYSMYRPPELIDKWHRIEQLKELERQKKARWKEVSQWQLVAEPGTAGMSFDVQTGEGAAGQEWEMWDAYAEGHGAGAGAAPGAEGENEVPYLYVSKDTGEVKHGVHRCWEWAIESDPKGWPRFRNTETDEVREKGDPRLDESESASTMAEKGFALGELRFVMYFCRTYVEDFDTAGEDVRMRRIALRTIRKNNTRLKHLSSLLVRMRKYFSEEDMASHPELVEAHYIAGRVFELYDLAVADQQEAEQIRQHLLRESLKRQEADKDLRCRKCGHSTERHLTYCGTCGVRQVWI